MNAVITVPEPRNEPQLTFAPGSPERESLQRRVGELAAEQVDLTMTIDGVQRMARGDEIKVVQPHNHRHVLGVARQAANEDVADAAAAAKRAAPEWRALPQQERDAVFLRAAELLAGPWRDTVNAATMLGQSKSAFQAEIDAACELIDFLRYNVFFAHKLLGEQPLSSPGVWNRFDHRPLEGFVLAITPFNFTAIAGNLPTSPALLGNVVIWKPSPTQQLAAHYFMRVLEAAGMPPGVINMVTGDGHAVSEVALNDADLAGLHFTGSVNTFQHLWRTIGENISRYKSYPRIVGETGGKDFVIAHPSADADALHTALIRGAYEYQGQKCSAASRAYIPRSIWQDGLRDRLVASIEEITYGDVSDFSHFGGAVIDHRSYDRLSGVLQTVASDPDCTVLAGGKADDSEGYFVQPTLVEVTDPEHESFWREYFGPILAVHVYEDDKFGEVVAQAADIAPYGLTGALFATDRRVIDRTSDVLRFSAGNFYINDKPTGAVVGHQPFGGARGSGTNDKAGSWQNLVRWISPRTIKETFVPPTDWRYPHMG
ncbi:MAG: L-glutamate gamma-semialdehyde dehydrogenase [Micromonosporaceae bacterium]|nr:L-glutamate gamma-semialdehyde dehydrogenase [Micromonosporaceae bacterium]